MTACPWLPVRGHVDVAVSAVGRILAVMTEYAVIPAWVVADHRQMMDFDHLVFELATKVESVHAQGQRAAVEWVTGGRPAPMTQRTEPVTWALARAESWVALCVAAWNGQPTAREWEQLGVEPRPRTAGDGDFAHGAWRTLAWLLGVRPDPPVELPVRDADGTLLPGQDRYATRPNPSSPVWQAADERRRGRNRAEAQRWCQHVRDRVEVAEYADLPRSGFAG